MSSLHPDVHDDETSANPLDLVEKLAVANDWPFQRQTDDELAAEIAGQWCHYKLWFAWHPELGVMHLSCALDMKVPAKKRTPVYALLAMANEKLWLGHFDLWADEGLPVFRHAVLFREGTGASSELVEDLVDIAVSECERFYPAFQFVSDTGEPHPALRDLIAVLPESNDGWTAAFWLFEPTGRLQGARPVDRFGEDPTAVITAAKHAFQGDDRDW